MLGECTQILSVYALDVLCSQTRQNLLFVLLGLHAPNLGSHFCRGCLTVCYYLPRTQCNDPSKGSNPEHSIRVHCAKHLALCLKCSNNVHMTSKWWWRLFEEEHNRCYGSDCTSSFLHVFTQLKQCAIFILVLISRPVLVALGLGFESFPLVVSLPVTAYPFLYRFCL